jgi:hypothetical protein
MSVHAPANEQSITVDRRYTDDFFGVDDVFVDFSAPLQAFDSEGSAGTIGIRQGTFFHLHQNFPDGDDSGPEFTSTGAMVVENRGYVLATIEPSGTQLGWGFHLLPDEECPDGFICVDPPAP